MVTCILIGMLLPDALMRALMMFIVAFVVGSIGEQMRCYYDRKTEKNRELSDANARMQVLNIRLAESEEACRIANKKIKPPLRHHRSYYQRVGCLWPGHPVRDPGMKKKVRLVAAISGLTGIGGSCRAVF